MTDFIRNAKSYVAKVKETKNPIAITVNGEAEVVIVDAAEYQALVDESERTRLIAAIREAENEVIAGRHMSAKEAFANLRRSFEVPR